MLHRCAVFWAILVLQISLSLFGVNGKNLKLLILHNNDLHGRFEETSQTSGTCKTNESCYGGFARTASVIREARNATKNSTVLYLNAGDTYTGTTYFSIHKWRIAADFMNILAPDAMSFGNHEFDEGMAGIRPFLDNISFPVIATNLEGAIFEPKSVVRSLTKIVEEQKVGILGYLTPDTVTLSSPENFTILDEVSSLQEECKNFERQGVKIVIAVGHSGFGMDKKIAQNVECVDVVIGGHTNTFLWNGPEPDLEKSEGPYPYMVRKPSGRIVPVVQAYGYSKYIGKLNVEFDENGELIEAFGQPVLLDKSIPQAQDVLSRLEIYRPEVEKLYKETLGVTRVLLDGNSKICRQRECNFGNFISDCFVEYNMVNYLGELWTDTPIGLIQGGGIRNGIPKGSVSRGDLIPCMPFENPLVSASIKGSDLKKTLEIGVRSNGETSRGEFLQLSGLRVVYDMSKPVGSRVVDVQVLCNRCDVPEYEPIVWNKTYRLITNGFLMRGGDGYHILKEKTFDKNEPGVTDTDVVQWCLKKNSPIYKGVEGRIRFNTANSLTINGIIIVTPFLVSLQYIFR